MRHRRVISLTANGTIYHGQINGMALEDGSGKNWLVTLALVGGGVETIFVRAE